MGGWAGGPAWSGEGEGEGGQALKRRNNLVHKWEVQALCADHSLGGSICQLQPHRHLAPHLVHPAVPPVLPHHRVDGHIRIAQGVVKPQAAVPPVDVQILCTPGRGGAGQGRKGNWGRPGQEESSLQEGG